LRSSCETKDQGPVRGDGEGVTKTEEDCDPEL